MAEAGAAVMCPDAELTAKLPGLLRDLLTNQQRLDSMARSARTLGRPEAAATIAGAVIALARRHHGGS